MTPRSSRRRHILRALHLLTSVGLAISCTATGDAEPDSASPATAIVVDSVDWNAVDAAMGRPGSEQPGGVRRYGFPRGDMRVTSEGVAIKPAFALGGWVAMKAVAGGVVAMGDLVLAE